MTPGVSRLVNPALTLLVRFPTVGARELSAAICAVRSRVETRPYDAPCALYTCVVGVFIAFPYLDKGSAVS